MSKSAFAGFCLIAFAGGVITTVLVERLSGRSRGPSPVAVGERALPPPAPSRPPVTPEFQALPPRPAAEAPAPPHPLPGRPHVVAKEAKAANEPVRPVRAGVRARAVAPRKAGAGAPLPTAAQSRGDAETRPQPRAWTDPFAD